MECSGFNDGAFIPLFSLSSGCSIYFFLLNIPFSGVWLAVFSFFSYYLFPKTFLHPFSYSPNVVYAYTGVLKKAK